MSIYAVAVRSIPRIAIPVAAALTTALTVGCSTYHPAVVAFQPPVSTAPATWDSILAHPVAVTVTTWTTGEVKVERALLLNLDASAAAALPHDKVWVPVLAHRIHHPMRGTWLLDTGFDSTFAVRKRGNIGGLATLAAPFLEIARQQPGADAASRLRADHDTLRGVVFTHLHLDHSAGVPTLPKEIPYIIGAGTLEDAYESSMVAHIDHLRGIAELQAIDFTPARPIAPFGPAVDLFGDGSVWAIHTPGHSRGHLSLLVNAATGPVLLVGDASHTRWGWDHDVAPGKVTDRAASEESLRQLRAFAARYPQVKVVFGHEL
jgi:glyoxylase-like metal-dependent hydrolase (beta-lactamase superfamily II)